MHMVRDEDSNARVEASNYQFLPALHLNNMEMKEDGGRGMTVISKDSNFLITKERS